jgi:hypothetical protein
MLRKLLLLALVCAAPRAFADAPASKCTAPEYRQFDFWLGDWDTFEPDASGKTTGGSVARTRVDSVLGGCAVHELYEQIDGLVGDAMLSYDGVRKKWQQTWVTNFGSILQIHGDFKDGVLTLEGEMHGRDGKSWLQRVTWKAEGKGVRETSVRSKDAGKTWEPAFDVLFVKRS